MLFPSPFIAAFGLKVMLDKTRREWRFHFPLRSRNVSTLVILTVILVSGWTLTYATLIPHQRVWISSSAYQKLVWLSNNRLVGKPIFIYSDYDEYAGGMGALWDNWVQAIYGDHYSYVGRLDFLLARLETPFESVTSRTVSLMFMDRIVKDGVFDTDTIPKPEIVILEDFYRLGELRNEYKGLLKQISEGIFVVDTQEAENRQTDRIALYSSVYEKLGNWYSIETNWTLSPYALEFWDPDPSGQSFFETIIPVASQGQFSLSLRYRDGSASDLIVQLNGTFLGRIQYEQTGQPRTFSTNVLMSRGIYSLKVGFEYEPSIPQYASLDFVEITEDRI